MRNSTTALATIVVLAAGGAYWYSTRSTADVSKYTDTNINFGALRTDAALTACPSQPAGHERLVCLANTLTANVTPDIKAQLVLPYSVEDAKKWSNFPPVGYPDRIGPTLGAFKPEQLPFVKAILTEASGIAANEGLDEIAQILNADDYLKANTADTASFSSGNYHIAFLGQPSAKGIWQLYFGGHHLAVANTYIDGKLTGGTPSFRGVEPFTSFTQNGRDNAPMVQEQAAFAAMLGALTPEQAAKATLTMAYTDIIVGPQKDNAFPTTKEGVRAGDMDTSQQALVLAAIKTYVGDIDPANAALIMARYTSEIAETFVAFSGTPGMNTENDYVRIDGPSVWIESSMQPGRSVPGIHPHSVWRDRTADYGGNG